MNREIQTAVKALLLVLVWTVLPTSAQRFVNVSLDGSQTVYSISQDKMGLMWMGTENGLYCYDGYHAYRLFQDHTASQSRVNALAFEGDSVFLATGEQRVINARSPRSVYESSVYALLHTPKGLLVGTISGLYIQGKTQTTRKLISLTDGRQPLVNALAFDAKRKCYWIGTEGALYRADLRLSSFVRVEMLDGNSVKCLVLDGKANLYIGTDNGLYTMSASGALSHFVHNSRDAYSISNNVVWSCYVDKWQNVWIGTDNGLSRLITSAYYQYFPWESITKSGEGNCLHAILQDKKGGWWMGGTNGLIHFTGEDVVWYKQNNPSALLTHNRVRKFYEDHDGDIWIATDHGFNLYDRTTGQMHNVIVHDKSGKYSAIWAYDILEDPKGRMWMAAYTGGVFVIDKLRLKQAVMSAIGNATATCVSDSHFSNEGKNALADLHIGQIVMDKHGLIWASSSQGLDIINPLTWKVTHVKGIEAVSYLMSDREGCVWAGGVTGVHCYDGSREVKNWKIGSKVSCMADVEGEVWVVTDRECCVFNHHGKSLRFKIPAVTPLAIYYSAVRKRVLMGGNDGFVSIDAGIVEPRVRPMPLMLANVTVNKESLLRANFDSSAVAGSVKAPHYLKKLTLASDENNFTLQLSDLPFANHASDVYAYRLEGGDHDWRYLDGDNIDITYNGLPYGDYHLTVHVTDGEGNVGDEVYSLDISILPPWYLTIWAKLFYLLLAILLVVWATNYYLVRKRLTEERRQKAEILEQVQMRMNFFAKLSERLKAAVTNRSFDEVTDLIKNSLDVNGLSASSAPMVTTTEMAALANDTAGVQGEEPSEKALAEEAKQTPLSESDQRLLKEITEAIETHMIDSDFNVTTLQEMVGIGSKQLYRKVKALTGMTPVEYIRGLRLRKASMMLNEGKFSVSEVMYTVGFSSSSYFSKCFSKAFGMTPTEYMRK